MLQQPPEITQIGVFLTHDHEMHLLLLLLVLENWNKVKSNKLRK